MQPTTFVSTELAIHIQDHDGYCSGEEDYSPFSMRIKTVIQVPLQAIKYTHNKNTIRKALIAKTYFDEMTIQTILDYFTTINPSCLKNFEVHFKKCTPAKTYGSGYCNILACTAKIRSIYFKEDDKKHLSVALPECCELHNHNLKEMEKKLSNKGHQIYEIKRFRTCKRLSHRC